ncbi:MAG: flagellar hook capping FlgD N-terminal domain-containing protein [Planctomycetaceae bacterium]|nr:flagellar hook capping FlgD N-terminal domain-containing protein [Planctomycetaceae bacterium]
MATIDEIRAQSAAQNAIKIVDKDKAGFSGLNSEDFMKLLIVQLQNQDPSNPMDSDQLLNQISQMRQLQASLELENSLKGLTLSQQLSSATSFIGKNITAVTGSEKKTVTGVVDSVLVKDNKTLLKVSGAEIPLADVTNVAA